MKTPETMIASVNFQKLRQEECSSTSSESLQKSKLLDREAIIHLWGVMRSVYLHKWTSMYPDGEIDPGNVWARALRGLSMSDIRRGLNALVDKRIEWPPSAIEFLKLCEQCDDDLGVPGAGLAVSLFLKQLSMAPHARNWSDIHPAVYWCYKQIGSFDCANHSQDKLAARFKDLWPQAVDLAKSGKLQVPQENRIESTTGTITPGIAESEIQKIKGIFND